MGRRHTTKPHKILDAVDISTNQSGEWTDVSNYDSVKYLVDWSGAAVGVMVVETSDDQVVTHPLDFGSVITISGSISPAQHDILIQSIAHKYMRIKYVSSSSTGSLTASITMTTKGA